uniref:Uncharacterized protein n=1 Tax=Arundo donax TaxID=35708 RepID=A0A0A9GVN4_ARUDO
MSFSSLAKFGEETLRLKLLDCHKDSVPRLADAYATASAGGVPLEVQL